uniref:VWFA domain-containing protein n=1 Tax=Rhabditophanes sp. KR3021 TaxID=114890 RepID=A0AC35TXN7_9BILA
MVFSEDLGYDPEEWEECEDEEHVMMIAPFTRILLAAMAIAFVGFFFWVLDARKEWKKLDEQKKDANIAFNENGQLKKSANLSYCDDSIKSKDFQSETIVHVIDQVRAISNDLTNRQAQYAYNQSEEINPISTNQDDTHVIEANPDELLNRLPHNAFDLPQPTARSDNIYSTNVIYSSPQGNINDISNDASVSLERSYEELAEKVFQKITTKLSCENLNSAIYAGISNYKQLAASLTELCTEDIRAAMNDVISHGGSKEEAEHLKHKLEEHIKSTVWQHTSFEKREPTTSQKPNKPEPLSTDKNSSGESDDNEFEKIYHTDTFLNQSPGAFSDTNFQTTPEPPSSYDVSGDMEYVYQNEPELPPISEHAAEEEAQLMKEYSFLSEHGPEQGKATSNPNELHYLPTIDSSHQKTTEHVLHLQEIDIHQGAGYEVNEVTFQPLIPQHQEHVNDTKQPYILTDFDQSDNEPSKHLLHDTAHPIIKTILPESEAALLKEIEENYGLGGDINPHHSTINIQPSDNYERKMRQVETVEKQQAQQPPHNIQFVDEGTKEKTNFVTDFPLNEEEQRRRNAMEAEPKHPINHPDAFQMVTMSDKEGLLSHESLPSDVKDLLKEYDTPAFDPLDNSYKDEFLDSEKEAGVVIENFLADFKERRSSKEEKHDVMDIDEDEYPKASEICRESPPNVIIQKPSLSSKESDHKNIFEQPIRQDSSEDIKNKVTADIYLQDAIEYMETQDKHKEYYENGGRQPDFVMEEKMIEEDIPIVKMRADKKVSSPDATNKLVKTNDAFEKIEVCIDEVDDTITYAPEIQSLEIPPDQLSITSEHVTDNLNEPIPLDEPTSNQVKVNLVESLPRIELSVPLPSPRKDTSKSGSLNGCGGQAPQIRRSHVAHGSKLDEGSSITSDSKKRKQSQSSLLSILGVTSTQEMLLQLTSLDALSQAMRKAGLQSTNLIFGIDYTASNKYQGENSFNGKSLHTIEATKENPYQQVIKIMGKTLAPFATTNGIPVYGFGDARTGDWSVFKLKQDGECADLDEVLNVYNQITPNVNLSGPTNFAPLIQQAMEICAHYKEYFILVIIADGQVTNEKATRRAIVQACQYPLSIIVVGVGDGPWEMMKVFDESLPKRPWDNFHFVEFHDIIQDKANNGEGELSFAIHSLLEIPDQYNYVKNTNLIKGRIHSPHH